MNVKDLLKEVESEIDDIRGTNFEYLPSAIIPNRSDKGLTFGRGEIKKGKRIETCVLYVDIRNSVKLTELHQNKTMAKLYTVFTNGVIKAAREYGGHIRNIIGDRVMVIFEPENCFNNAIDCAITINHIAQIINEKFILVNFKCGIGIDYGNMRVLKVGVHVRGTNNIENKGLVWTGKPANYASRLTDFANKSIETTNFEVKVKKYPIPWMRDVIPGYSSFTISEEIRTLTSEDFLKNIHNSDDGKLRIGFFEEVLSYKKVVEKNDLPAILVSEKIFKEYKKIRPNCESLVQNYWGEISTDIKDITSSVFGANLIWK